MKLPKFNEENIILGWDPKISKKQNLEFANVIYNYKWIAWKNRNNKIFNNKTEEANILYLHKKPLILA
jgi:hypothetical protein